MISCAGDIRRGFDHACETFDSYRFSEVKTKEWVQNEVNMGLASWEAQEYTTSFIMYKNYESLLPFLKEVYDTIFFLRQPYCQAIWGIMIQSKLENIQLQSIPWTEINMFRKTPLPFIEDRKRALRGFAKKFLFPLINFLGFDYEKFRKNYIVKIFGVGIK